MRALETFVGRFDFALNNKLQRVVIDNIAWCPFQLRIICASSQNDEGDKTVKTD
jgi:hypothetical protein